MMDEVIEGNATNATNPKQVWQPPPLQQPYDIAEAAHPGWQAAMGGGNHERCEADSRPLRLLLAEPARQLRHSMVKVLGRLRYEILTATDGFEVLCRLPEWRPDVLLMASELPRLGGTQVCALLRDSPDFRALPIILLVDSDPFLDVIKAEEAGADAYLKRPFRLAELRAVLADIGKQRSDEQWAGHDAGWLDVGNSTDSSTEMSADNHVGSATDASAKGYKHSEKISHSVLSHEAGAMAAAPARAG